MNDSLSHPFDGRRTEAPVEPLLRAADFQRQVRHYVRYILARQWKYATPGDLFTAVSLALRERLIDTHVRNEQDNLQRQRKRIYYLSMEFLMGRSLGNNLINLGVYDLVRDALGELGADLGAIEDVESDAALGNGGLGRLAACFLDSLATLGEPAYGYGINYEFGLFRQCIVEGEQVERPDAWGKERSPWLMDRPHATCEVPVYGRMVPGSAPDGSYRPAWTDRRHFVGRAQDMPIVGYGGQTVNFLRLFSAQASDHFDIEIFNAGDYVKAVEAKILTERISKVLYPADDVGAGRELRLLQEYFLVSCAIQDILQRFATQSSRLDRLPELAAIQMNDTHPSLAVAELMRLLVDEHQIPWTRAFEITQQTLAYTNHTLLPEALEKWPEPLLQKVVPRHLQIIHEINRRFLDQVALTYPGDEERLRKLSLIEESDPKQVRMAHLAIVGSHSVNGVAELHSHLLRTQVFPEHALLRPEAFHNKTNGVTQRRWLLHANPGLSRLLTDAISDRWILDFDALKDLLPWADDDAFRARFRAVKRQNKDRLARTISRLTGIRVDRDALFDIQAKRIHLYKRQLLHLLLVLHEYLSLVEDRQTPAVARVHVFAGKAAPGYRQAKLVIHLMHTIAEVVNHDARCRGHLQVIFLPDYRVTLAEQIIPAADLSEQISTAGMEASGTGNMKFAMNGALTIGTRDGANLEIEGAVGAENMFLFGLDANGVESRRRGEGETPAEICARAPEIARILDALGSDRFSGRRPGRFQELVDMLRSPGDAYLHVADLADYCRAQSAASSRFQDPEAWTRMAIRNVAGMGMFSSDRTVRQYLDEVWHRAPVTALV